MKTPGECVAEKRGWMISPGRPAMNKPGATGDIIWGGPQARLILALPCEIQSAPGLSPTRKTTSNWARMFKRAGLRQPTDDAVTTTQPPPSVGQHRKFNSQWLETPPEP
jgi:hypothetical protein